MLLEDLRVLDLTDHRGEVGPWLLGRLGAEIIKVEPLGGSSARSEPPFTTSAPEGFGSLQFAAYNDNKQSVELDLDSGAGREALLKLAAGAEIKLRHFGLWERFPFGAFADDAHEREQLGPIALGRANTYHETNFPADGIIVIGDTVRDVACAYAFGARSLAVASGRTSVDELRAAGADCVVESLEDDRVPDFIGFST